MRDLVQTTATAAQNSDRVVYALVDPRASRPRPFYIGIGAPQRPWQHFSRQSLERDRNRHKTKRIRRLRELGYRPRDIIRILATDLTTLQTVSMERELIARLGRRSDRTGFLLNLTAGGDLPRIDARRWSERRNAAACELTP